jgi:uncharacterized protein YbcV (DUF1398 family)
MTSEERIAVMKECKELSLRGTPFPEIVRRLSEAGVERYHVDLSRDETTYYLPSGAAHAFRLGLGGLPIADTFDAGAVEEAVRGAQRGEVPYPEFVRRIKTAGCVEYHTRITGRRVQYLGRTGDMHVEPFV